MVSSAHVPAPVETPGDAGLAATRPRGREREIKIAHQDLDAVRTALQKAGAAAGAEQHLERNWVLDDADGVLVESQRLLRVREQRRSDGTLLGSWLTVKGPLPPDEQARADRDQVKERQEHETLIESAEETLAALAVLGYRPARRYEKVRSSFLLSEHEVTLDETPIGTFVEIEGPDPRSLADRLGLDLGQVELASYLALYDSYRHDKELGPDMLFADPGSCLDHGTRPMPPGFEKQTAREPACRPAEEASA